MRWALRHDYNMEDRLQELIRNVCSGFPTVDVNVSHIFDARRFAIMVHFAWKHDIGFHPDMFKAALKATELFQAMPDNVIEEKASELCYQADFAKSMYHAAFDLEHLSL